MEVDLLRNALVSTVGGLSGPPGTFDPANARPPVQEAAESPGITDEAQNTSPDNTRVEVTRKPVNDEPKKDFQKTLEEKIQAEVSQTPENATKVQPSVEATATPNQVSAEQAQPVSAEASTDLSVALDEIVAETTNIPQKELAAEKSQDLAKLLTGSGVSKAVDPTVAKSDQASLIPTPAMVQSPGKLTELTVEQSQIQPKVAQPTQGNAASVLDAQPAGNEQIEPKMATNDVLTLQKGAALEAKTGELVSESLADGQKTNPSSEKSGGVIEQIVAKTGPAPQNNPDVPEEGSPDNKHRQGEQSPKISEKAFIETDGKASADRQTKIPPESPDGNGAEAGHGKKTLSGDFIITQKPDSVQAESAPSHTKGNNTPASDSNNSPHSEQAIPVDGHQISKVQQPLAAAQAPKSAANPSGADIPSTVREQIRESITTSAVGSDREITIRLNPPELGSVVVKFQERADGISGLLEVSKPQTRAEIQLALPEITRDLQELGVQVRRLEVVMTSQQDNQAPNGQAAMQQQYGWAGQQGATSSDPHAENTSPGEFLGENSAYTGFAGGSQVYITDKSIDMFA